VRLSVKVTAVAMMIDAISYVWPFAGRGERRAGRHRGGPVVVLRRSSSATGDR
jgi:hypothetical protein